jgi:hypothetical protein
VSGCLVRISPDNTEIQRHRENRLFKVHLKPVFSLCLCISVLSMRVNQRSSVGCRRIFFRVRFRAKACLIRLFSPGLT